LCFLGGVAMPPFLISAIPAVPVSQHRNCSHIVMTRRDANYRALLCRDNLRYRCFGGMAFARNELTQ
jgi:hypothetical protein